MENDINTHDAQLVQGTTKWDSVCGSHFLVPAVSAQVVLEERNNQSSWGYIPSRRLNFVSLYCVLSLSKRKSVLCTISLSKSKKKKKKNDDDREIKV
jgi:hypothetical protein